MTNTEKYRPSDLPLYGIYGPDFWSVVYENFYHFFRYSLTLGLTGKIPQYRFLTVKWCGNPQCGSIIKYFEDERPPSCENCKKQINWE